MRCKANHQRVLFNVCRRFLMLCHICATWRCALQRKYYHARSRLGGSRLAVGWAPSVSLAAWKRWCRHRRKKNRDAAVVDRCRQQRSSSCMSAALHALHSAAHSSRHKIIRYARAAQSERLRTWRRRNLLLWKWQALTTARRWTRRVENAVTLRGRRCLGRRYMQRWILGHTTDRARCAPDIMTSRDLFALAWLTNYRISHS